MESRYAWVERFLSTHSLDEAAVMEPIAEQILGLVSTSYDTLVVRLDQTCIGNTHGIAMSSLRVGNRGVSLFWRVEQTAGNIATKQYLSLLDRVDVLLPEGASVILMADRFFDSETLIAWCQRQIGAGRRRKERKGAWHRGDRHFVRG